MEAERQIREMTPKAQYHYNMAQCHLIAYQMERGLIDDPLGYDDSAEIFEMVANKAITTKIDIEWKQVRMECDRIRTPTNDQALNVIFNKKTA